MTAKNIPATSSGNNRGLFVIFSPSSLLLPLAAFAKSIKDRIAAIKQKSLFHFDLFCKPLRCFPVNMDGFPTVFTREMQSAFAGFCAHILIKGFSRSSPAAFSYFSVRFQFRKITINCAQADMRPLQRIRNLLNG